MPLLKVSLEKINLSQKHDLARQLAIYFNSNMERMVATLPSQPVYVEAFTQLACETAQDDHFIDSQALSLYVTVSLMLGIRWPQDPLYKHLMDVYGQISWPYDEMLNILMYQAKEDKKRLVQTLPVTHKQCLLLLQEPPENFTAELFDRWWFIFTNAAKISNRVNTQDLPQIYERDLRLHLGLSQKEISQNAMPYQGHQPMQNTELTIETQYWVYDSLPSARYVLLLHCYLSLAFGRFYLDNPLHRDLHALLNWQTTELSQMREAVSQFLIKHINLLGSQ